MLLALPLLNKGILMKYLFFNYHRWDDDKGPGWDSLFHKSNANDVAAVKEEVKAMFLEKELVNGKLQPKYWAYDDYQIVSLETLEIVERGECKNTYNDITGCQDVDFIPDNKEAVAA